MILGMITLLKHIGNKLYCNPYKVIREKIYKPCITFCIMIILNHKDERKNNFILKLRDYINELFGTEASLVKSGDDPYKPIDISGIVLSKDTCSKSYGPYTESELIKKIHEFALKQGAEVTKHDTYLGITLGNKSYTIITYVDDLYAGKISIHID